MGKKWVGGIVLVLFLSWGLGPRSSEPPQTSFPTENLPAFVFPSLLSGEFPTEIEISGHRTAISYTLDPVAQQGMEKLMRLYGPDYGAFVALDAETGRLLSLVSYARDGSRVGNLALTARFPAASIFKIVTAAALIDQSRMTPDTVIAFNGANHTLYRKHVTTEAGRLRRRMTLREAFAKSVNTVFARMGVFFLKPLEIESYARRFGFNQAFAADMPLEAGTLRIPEGDAFKVGEIASGFTRESLLSPLHGALIASAIAHDGVMMAPQVVDRMVAEDGTELFRAELRITAEPVSAETADKLRALMRETVVRGTARKSFVSFLRRAKAHKVEVGGKTGSLTSLSPPGKCDWFVGYARQGGRRVALAALTVNREKWRVKSAYLTRTFVERYWVQE